MRKASAVRVVIAVCLAFLLSMVPWRPTPARQQSLPRYRFDFSAGCSLASVGWPASNTSHIWFLEGPGEIEIVMPDGRRGTCRFIIAHVKREGDCVRAVQIGFSPGSLDHAHAQASALLSEWKLRGQDSLDTWREKRRIEGIPYAWPDLIGWRTALEDKKSPFPRIGVCVDWTFADDLPWCVFWGTILFPPGKPDAMTLPWSHNPMSGADRKNPPHRTSTTQPG